MRERWLNVGGSSPEDDCLGIKTGSVSSHIPWRKRQCSQKLRVAQEFRQLQPPSPPSPATVTFSSETWISKTAVLAVEIINTTWKIWKLGI